MAAGTAPIFVTTPALGWGTTALTTANTAKDGTGTVLTIFTAGSNGSFVQKVVARAAGSNVATVLRIFINNGGSTATPANNILFTEMTLAATTLSETSALAAYEIPLNIMLEPSYTLTATIGTTVSAGYYVSAVGGDY